ncbi:MAG: UTP--glucose-1-phosphate uridylyltransferase GalU [Desulfofustis sp. PB-SRB1]|jgi:UTP--glucose-1-phosphate uridylyltransferase|nr:UTP--glucose-1-phosphate uridylyltransferase GalU [Desulfofustis sp. PB-SRB1]MBM1001446.1 UTP--glucose-1-phosphate uridylyltransferase GalU [Desulfofustis sp. PB-SRB1]HBH28972.1 UTP--glucose-1-phosphate uridylyltransferase [Desulfofustis sp.]HBH31559.1 UTP--glucose-1-phosphate uridylyltransferase [Desulfofustis sp.]
MKVRKAVIPVAGLGTRFLPATKAIPKEMLTIVDRPTIQYIVEEVVNSGIEQIIFITSDGKSAIENHFDYDYQLDAILKEKKKTALGKELDMISNLIDIVSVRQKKPLGLGHAIWSARHIVGNEPFMVCLGDDLVLSTVPCAKQMLDLYEDVGESIVAVQRVAPEHRQRYGIVEGEPNGRDNTFRVVRMVEKPAPGTTDSDLAIIGRYILKPEIFEILSGTTPGHGGEIQLTDALLALSKQRSMFAYEFTGTCYDAGDKFGFLQAVVAYGMKHAEIGAQFRQHIKEIAATL